MMNDPAIETCSEGEAGPELAERLSHRMSNARHGPIVEAHP
jgi:hypothetical protein